MSRHVILASYQGVKEHLKRLEYVVRPSSSISAILRTTTTDPWMAYIDSATELRRDILFVHIPKTAGTAVLRAFGFKVGHVPITRYYAWNRDRTSTAFKFSVVRNPWHRLRSGYFFLRERFDALGTRERLSPTHRWRYNWIQRHIIESGSFETFVISLKRKTFWRSVRNYYIFRPQMDWISLNLKESHVMDWICRFETIERDIEYVRDISGVNAPLERSRVTSPYTAEFTPEMVDIVGTRFGLDIRSLGYGNDDP